MGDDIIDSRDIIARYEELKEEYDSLVESLDDYEQDFESFLKIADEELTEENDTFEEKCKSFRESIQDAQEALDNFDSDEMDFLAKVIEEGENSPDWSYGETLIHEDYFTDYMEEFVNDCYEFPSEFTDGKWPWNHMSMDWEGLADEAKADYITIDVCGNVYYVRA